ncbi:TDT family transporter [Motilimonas cestriensis]|uniref:TDT family transporter n=1 Tax=Motilimonas cestriensis TaxID=2742685 RepID=A0ABS8WAV2_9GAMM|nr:TDT family transporter [Motilimonas cestriensis]MCE2596137.1 TDT family transporter [Motilimonas cestriensis]
MKSIRQRASMIHTPMAGLALAIASLGWGWDQVSNGAGHFQLLSAQIAALLLLVLLIKFVLHPTSLLADLAHPVVGSVVPTFAMASMVVASTFASHHVLGAKLVWLAAIALHITFLLMFTYHRARQFKLTDMVPSWFVPPVGIIVAALTCPATQFTSLATVLLYFGLACYAVLLPLMLFRLCCCGSLPTAAKPTLAILAAPASLGLAGYLNLVAQPDYHLLVVLLVLAILMTGFLYLAFFRLLQLPFSPGYAAFTFPTVIGATALFKLAGYIEQQGHNPAWVEVLQHLAKLELVVATVVVSYVALHYLVDQVQSQRGFQMKC